VTIGVTRDLEIDQDIEFQRRSWRVQRIGWVAMVILVGLGLVGGLGSGPLSRQVLVVPGVLHLDYKRLTRYQSPEKLIVRLQSAAISGREVGLWIDREYLDASKVETVTPPPIHVESGADRLVYFFRLARTGEPAAISFLLHSEHLGPVAGRIGIVDSDASISFRQFVYP
jgi:hypothetical protein